MKTRIFSGLLLVLVACVPAAVAEPVVVELFTSEGCSSCPPADALLRELGERVDVIILAWHVDYWDRLGWADPFGEAAYSERQLQYARLMNLNSRYTPQMIINGNAEFNGRDKARALREIERAGAFPASVTLDSINISDGAIAVNATVRNAAPKSRLLVAITEHGLETPNIPRGENRGKTLLHDGVVRYYATLDLHDDQLQSHTLKLPLDAAWIRANSKVVALIESQENHGVSAATIASMPASKP